MRCLKCGCDLEAWREIFNEEHWCDFSSADARRKCYHLDALWEREITLTQIYLYIAHSLVKQQRFNAKEWMKL
jgi:hypothetical protein